MHFTMKASRLSTKRGNHRAVWMTNHGSMIMAMISDSRDSWIMTNCQFSLDIHKRLVIRRKQFPVPNQINFDSFAFCRYEIPLDVP